MYDYNTLCDKFLQYKKFLGFKYKTDAVVINQIKNYLTEKKVNIITKEITENFARINKNLHSNTVARNMGVLKEFCLYLKTQNIECYQIPHNIYPQSKRNFIPYIFSHNEIKTIYNNLNKINSNYKYSYYSKCAYPLIIKILYQTGIRVGEIINLKIRDYNHVDGFFILKNTKNEQERIIILPNSLNNEISCFHDKFHFNQNIDNTFFKVSYSSINNYFHKLLKLSNIKRYEKTPRIHDFRHTFIIHSIEKNIKEGKDVNVLLPILRVHLGHQSLDALLYYFRLTNNILNDINNISEAKLGYLIPKLDVISND